MNEELYNLLQDTCAPITDKSKYSHYTCYDPRGRWSLNRQNTGQFWQEYCRIVYENSDIDNLNICETCDDIAPVIVDVKFKFYQKKSDWSEIYSDEFLYHLISICQDGIRKYFELSNSNDGLEVLCLVLESSDIWKELDTEGNTLIYSKLRIQFPFAMADVKYIEQYFRPYIIQKIRTNNIFRYIENMPIGDIDQLFPNVYDKPILMYGSEEVQGRPILKFVKVYGFIKNSSSREENSDTENSNNSSDTENNSEEYDNFEFDNNIELDDILDPEIGSAVKSNSMQLDFTEQEKIFWLPYFLSVNFYGEFMRLRKEFSDKNKLKLDIASPMDIRKVIGNKNDNHTHKPGLLEGENYLKICEDLLKIVDYSRCLYENSFFDIGRAFYHADQGSENALNSWIKYIIKVVVYNKDKLPDFIKITSKYSSADTNEEKITEFCKNFWVRLQYGNVTWKTLAYYAMKDDEAKYIEWHKKWSEKALDSCLSSKHADVAMAFFRCYFMYYIFDKKKWYRFNGNRWQECEDGIEIIEVICGDFCRRFQKLIRYYSDHAMEEDADVKEDGKKIGALTKLVDSLKTQSFLSSVLTNLRGKFQYSKFTSIVDNNVNLLSINNGVLEVVGNGVIFRQAKPEDYLRMGSDINFHDNYDFDHYLVRESMDWFHQLFDEPDTLDYFLKFGASIIQGRNRDKIFMIWSGVGNNGKSVLEKVFEIIFGEYCIKFPIGVLTDKSRRGSGPSPELARAKNKRVVFIDEPEDNMEMSKGTVKNITGGDKFFARALFENGEDIVATFKTILLCNRVPIFNNPDQAIKNRTRKLFFNATYSAEAPETLEEQQAARIYPMDTNFENRLPELAPAILWIFVQYFKNYVESGLKEPASVIQETQKYWEENDFYAQFFSEKVAPVYSDYQNGIVDTNAKLSLSQLYQEFVSWFVSCFPGTKTPNRKDLKMVMEERFCKIDKDGWRGLRIITDEEQLDYSESCKNYKSTKYSNKPDIVEIRPISPIVSPKRHIENISRNSGEIKIKSPQNIKSPSSKVISPKKINYIKSPSSKVFQNPLLL